MMTSLQDYFCKQHLYMFFFFKQKTAYEMRISDWSSDVCSSDLARLELDSMELMRFANDDVTRRDPAAAIARDFPIAVCDREGAIVPRMIVKLIIAVGAKNVMHQASRPIILAREVPILHICAELIMGENFDIGKASGRKRVCQDV